MAPRARTEILPYQNTYTNVYGTHPQGYMHQEGPTVSPGDGGGNSPDEDNCFGCMLGAEPGTVQDLSACSMPDQQPCFMKPPLNLSANRLTKVSGREPFQVCLASGHHPMKAGGDAEVALKVGSSTLQVPHHMHRLSLPGELHGGDCLV